ncbi:MmoB/DmpM family protein [Actinomadura mexicana]|uniref:Toluene 4-monooxygenase protein D n=1 Tax=Actinomadura mexicana TaxID=134959 RepID=A0A238VNX4_9ACTN|nr:MmoB/DmpM family protein [Actinomadura mexicana]SNR35881.1 toluene 4-monooxygenase protein D [Actinomadura mexicana]
MTSTPVHSRSNLAGPLLRGGDMSVVAVEAIERDNPEKEILVDDHRTYVRVEAEGGLVIRRRTMEELLGRAFSMQELEISLTGYSGQIETHDEYMRWYFMKQS